MKPILLILGAVITVVFVFCRNTSAQKIIGRQQVIEVPVDQNKHAEALLWLPDDYASRPDKKYPLLIFLHGAGEGATDSIDELLHNGLPQLIAQGLNPYGIDSLTGDTIKYIVVSPHAAKSAWSYQFGHVKRILPFLEDNYRIDAGRVFISGISAGGFGTWTCVTDDTDFVENRIAGIIPISSVEVESKREPGILNAARYGLAVWAICGTKDAHYAGARRYDTLIRNAHPLVPNHLISVIGSDHEPSAWNPPYTLSYTGFNGKNLWTRMLDYKRAVASDADGHSGAGSSVSGSTASGSSGSGSSASSAANPAGTSSGPAAPDPASGSSGPITSPQATSPCKGIRRMMVPHAGGMYISGSAAFVYNPGDTLVLSTQYNPWAYFALEGIHGKPGCPVVVINEGGQVKIDAMGATNCTYIKFTGSGSPDKYGFYMSSPTGKGTAYNIDGRSAFIEVERSDIYHKTYGAWIKQEASCIDSLQYPNWRLHDISFHDNRMFNIGQDCIYAGSTSPNGMRPIACNGVKISPIPLRMGNIRIYNNLIDSVNRTGIQLSGADSGFNEIYNNRITRCGFELNAYQGNAISLGGYTHAYVHNNYIRQTFLNGIFCLGAGLIRIENNNIDSSGYLGKIVNPGAASIMVDTRRTNPVINTQFFVRNNVLGANTDKNVRVYKSFPTYINGNIISNNTGSAIEVESSIDWSSKSGKN